MTSSIMTSSIFSQFYSSSAWILRFKIYDLIKTGKYVVMYSITFQKIKTELKNLFLFAFNWYFSKVQFFAGPLTGAIFMMTSSTFGWRHQLENFFASSYHGREHLYQIWCIKDLYIKSYRGWCKKPPLVIQNSKKPGINRVKEFIQQLQFIRKCKISKIKFYRQVENFWWTGS